MTALAACSSGPLGSGTADPAGKLAHSEDRCWRGLRKGKENQEMSAKQCIIIALNIQTMRGLSEDISPKTVSSFGLVSSIV